MTLSTARYSQIQRFVSRAFSVLSAFQLCVSALAVPALIYYGRRDSPSAIVLALALVAVLVLAQGAMMALIERAQTWAGTTMVAEQTAAAEKAAANAPKKGFRGYGAKRKTSRRELLKMVQGGSGPQTARPHVANVQLKKDA